MLSQVRVWLRQHNQAALQEARTGKQGVRIIPCWLPVKSPWLNRIEPKWVHGKRAIVEPARLLTAEELRQRICDYFRCEQTELLTQKISLHASFSEHSWLIEVLIIFLNGGIEFLYSHIRELGLVQQHTTQ